LNNGKAVNEIVKAFKTQRDTVFADQGVKIKVGEQTTYRVKSSANINIPAEPVK
jgi:hypothetical protein